MTQSDVNKQLLAKDYCLYVTGIVVLATVALVTRHLVGWQLSAWWKLIAIILGCFGSAVWDSVMFFLTQDRDDPISLNRTRYRVGQFLTQWIFCLPLVLLLSNYWIALGSALCWWFGGFDLLFYVFRREPEQSNMTWLTWTLPALVTKTYPESWGFFVTFACVGYGIAIGSAFL